MNLYESLVKYSMDGYYPMHMPGHKRNTMWNHMVNPYGIDITEIEGFDNLHHAESILYEGMERAARLYGAGHTAYLINGSTVGLLAGISACTNKGDKVLVARNSHKAVYNAIYLNELKPVYIYPQKDGEFGINCGLNPSLIEDLLIKNQDAKLIIITSPTYEGIISDVSAISAIAHRYGVPLLVDEAHGAHFGFHKDFPRNAIKCGADIVIHSLHKTLPSFTQTALIHVNGTLVNYDNVKRYLSIYQSSSPSYLLMSSIEQCISLLETKGEELFDSYHKQLRSFYDKMNGLSKIKVLNPYQNTRFYGIDPSKITISVKGTDMTGVRLYERLLEQYKIQMELVSMDYVLGMTSICDTKEGFQRLEEALFAIDNEVTIVYEAKQDDTKPNDTKQNDIKPDDTKPDATQLDDITADFILPEIKLSSYEAIHRPFERILFSEGNGRISAEYVYLYPPGIPILVPGELINHRFIAQINEYKENGLSVQGTEDIEANYIKVVK
ncbi:MAG: decarboxylase [Anaerocolumna sp.]|nr:decarboxylase [Anaerocolumna sp.]